MKNDFSRQFRPILEKALVEARRCKSPLIQSEHLILSALQDRNGYSYKILSQLNVDIDAMTREIEEHLASSPATGESTTLFEQQYKITLGAIRHLQLATTEARQMHSAQISGVHILLALIHDNRDMDSQFLSELKKKYLNFDIAVQDLSAPPRQEPETPKDEGFLADDDDDEEFESPKGGGSGYGGSSFSSSRSQSQSQKQKGGTDTPAIDKFGYDMTAAAASNKLDPVVGRENEIERLAQILSRRKKNNPVLIGEPGVGKSAIVEGLALRIVQRKVSPILFGKRLVALDMAGMVAGTKYRGQFEERIKAVLDELAKNPDIIVFIDEIHTIVGAGGAPGSMDAANMMKPALSRGQIQCIGATTLDEYRQNIEKDGALERRFQKVMVEPTTPEETLEILENVKGKYEEHHNVTYTPEAVKACVDLTERYVSDRNFPDKALDALDEAGSRVHITNVEVPQEISDLEAELESVSGEKYEAASRQDFEKAASLRDRESKLRARIDEVKNRWTESLNSERRVVDENKVAEVVAMMTGVPTQRIAQAEGTRLLHMGDALQGSVIGQDDAIRKVVKAIQRNRIGLKDPNKPIGVFMFLGPTGVGKTLLAKKLSEYLFDSTDSLIRMDMSEFMEKFTVSRLVGAPPGYVGYEEGGQLTEKVRRHPYSVVLLDEIEKAHPDVFNILLQVMDEGRLTDSLGRRIDFKNTILIMTSNVGSRQLKEFGSGVGFNTGSLGKEQGRAVISKALNRAFSPEFLNRVDDIIMFDPLDKKAIFNIIDIELNDFYKRVENLGYRLTLTPEAKNFIAEKGYDKNFGARPLKRSIQKYLEDELAELMLSLSADGKTSGTISVTYLDGMDKLTLAYIPAPAPETSAEAKDAPSEEKTTTSGVTADESIKNAPADQSIKEAPAAESIEDTPASDDNAENKAPEEPA